MGLFNIFSSKEDTDIVRPEHKIGEFRVTARILMNGESIYIPEVYRYPLDHASFAPCWFRLRVRDYPFLEGCQEYMSLHGMVYIAAKSLEEVNEIEKLFKSHVAI